MSHISRQGSFFFLKREIPTRLAGMIMELRLLPPDLLQQKECTEVLNDYIASFRWCDAVCFLYSLNCNEITNQRQFCTTNGILHNVSRLKLYQSPIATRLLCSKNIKEGCKKKFNPVSFLFSAPILFRDLVTYERETGDVLERFNESLNMVRTRSKMVARFKMLSDGYSLQRWLSEYGKS